MRAYCPNCGSENEGAPGARITCTACTAIFDAPPESPRAPEPESPPPPRVDSITTPRSPVPITPSPLGGFAGSSPAGRPAPGKWVPGSVSVGGLGLSRPFVGPGAKNNTLAIVSLTTGIICCLPFGSFIAVGTGIAALKQIDASQGREQGKNLAIAGIVLGGLGVTMTLLGLLAALLGK